jgi:hypothetical protein
MTGVDMGIVQRYLQIFRSLPIILISIGLAGFSLFTTWFFIYIGVANSPPLGRPTALVTTIPGPTSTAYNPTPTAGEEPTPTSNLPPSPMPGLIGVGGYVQITGTEGSGLNVRSAPGLDMSVNFLALDAEVFEVRQGPKVVDDITWWYIVTPVDESRNGWAAANYLSVVDNPDQ